LINTSTSNARCPECGSGFGAGAGGAAEPGYASTLPAVDRARLRRGAALAGAAIPAFCFVPVLGTLVDAAAAILLCRLAASRGRGGVLATLTILLAGLTTALGAAAWWLVLSIEVAGVEYIEPLTDEIIAGSVTAAALSLWSVRHALVGWLVLRAGAQRDRSVAGALMVSTLGAPAIAVSGVLIIGLGVFVSHLALFPPLCFVLPIWVGAAGVWLVVTLAAYWRLYTSVTLRPARASPVRSELPVTSETNDR
ncbi:MAG: hypothetical protein AAF235_03725, partial [Planctomycetota bacterium]